MLAMDVVDTIRHRELLVARELSQGDRDEALRGRLREIYTGQGIEVTDAVIDQGIKALRESRFAYTPPPPSLGRTLAMVWIRRVVIGRWVGGILIAATALWGFQYFGYELPRQQAAQEAQLDLGERLPLILERELWQIIREAIVNAERHSKAKHLIVSAARSGDRITIAVRDDGVGLQEGKPFVRHRKETLSVVDVQFRMKLLRPGKHPLRSARGMWPEPGGVPYVPHVPHKQLALGIAQMQFCFDPAVMHVALRKPVAHKNDALALLRGSHGLRALGRGGVGHGHQGM
jgi:hypothetical protein